MQMVPFAIEHLCQVGLCLDTVLEVVPFSMFVLQECTVGVNLIVFSWISPIY